MNPGERDQTLLPPPQQSWSTPPPPPAPNDSVWNRIAAFLVLIAVVAAAAGAGIGWSLARAVNNHQSAQSTSQPLTPITQVTPGTRSPATGASTTEAIAARVRPAIVDINTLLGSGQAAGTGMIISPTGEILTNNHVVTGSTSITVTVQGSSRDYTAHVVGVNVSQDVAVIQIDQSVSGLPTVTFADSSSVQVGDPIVAIGNALGRGGAPATSGHVTALDQTITASEGRANAETLSGMIQSDAQIYEGDSGGALVNSSGQVIGMITAGEAQGFRSAASDVGYSVSANAAVTQANRILAHDRGTDLTYGQVGYLGVSVQDSASGGALVVGVQSGSPAAAAGISAGSVITAIGGTTVTSSDTLGAAIKAHRPGESVSVRWTTAAGTARTATVTLGGVNP
ncbi:MAG TPA: trypsin-like peptidase domain-containing protein [Candidatus Dormibacteraeota bacterium]|nr:trypsin-like peptidase domain-containing protein [Candidatus Dormibacteraeota bacterium]